MFSWFSRKKEETSLDVAAINDQIQQDLIKRALANFGSSTLSDVEKTLHNSTMLGLTDKYTKVMREKGGYSKVLNEMAQYIATETGNPEALLYAQKRASNTDPNQIALRALLDKSAERPFANILDPAADPNMKYSIPFRTSEGKVRNQDMHIREILAYYWIAASDKEALRERYPDYSEQQLEDELKTERSKLITVVAEIRKAHQKDYGILDSKNDYPSCPPGTIGRIAKINFANPVARMIPEQRKAEKLNVDFSTEAMNFIKGEIGRQANKELAEGAPKLIPAIQTLRGNYMMIDWSEPNAQESLKEVESDEDVQEAMKVHNELLKGLQAKKDEFINRLKTEYKNKGTFTTTQLEEAAAHFNAVVDRFSLDKLRNEANDTVKDEMRPAPVLMNYTVELNDNIIRKEILTNTLKKYNNKMQEEWKNQGPKLEARVKTIIEKMKANRSKLLTATPEEIERMGREINESYDEVIKDWEKLKNDIRSESKKAYDDELAAQNKVLEEPERESISDPWQIPEALSILKQFEQDTIGSYEKQSLSYVPEVFSAREKSIEKMMADFLTEKQEDQKTTLEAISKLNLDQKMLEIQKKAKQTPPETGSIRRQLANIEVELTKIKTPLDSGFAQYCKERGFNILPNEYLKARDKDPAYQKTAQFRKEAEVMRNDILPILDIGKTAYEIALDFEKTLRDNIKKLQRPDMSDIDTMHLQVYQETLRVLRGKIINPFKMSDTTDPKIIVNFAIQQQKLALKAYGVLLKSGESGFINKIIQKITDLINKIPGVHISTEHQRMTQERAAQAITFSKRGVEVAQHVGIVQSKKGEKTRQKPEAPKPT